MNRDAQKKASTTNHKSRGLKALAAILLSLTLMMSLLPVAAMVATDSANCVHVHDATCGYVKGTKGKPCVFTHAHDETCGGLADPAACTVMTAHQHDEACGFVPEVATVPCGHECTVESGCILSDAGEQESVLTEESDGDVPPDEATAETNAPENGKEDSGAEEGTTVPEQPEPVTLSREMTDGTEITVYGALPEGVWVDAVPMQATAELDAVLDSVVSKENRSVAVYAAYDITLYDADGGEWQPAEGQSVRVTIKNPEFIPETGEIAIAHVSDDMTAAEVVAKDTDTAEVEHFSVYVVYVLAENITVTFDLGYDTGAGEGAYKTVTLPEAGICEKPADPAREGYAFAGWYTAQETLFDFALDVNENLTLTAKWTTPSEVSNAAELQAAVNNAPDGALTVLTLTQDITFDHAPGVLELIIPEGKVITLRGGYKLMTDSSSSWGSNNRGNTTIDVYGTLVIDGVTVTHNGKGYGHGIEVFSGGFLTLASGIISENGGENFGTSGVRVHSGGVFAMSGGDICNNLGSGLGSAVHNEGVFTMTGGEIHDNASGAVYNLTGGVFNMQGGEIYGHRNSGGSGVTSSGTFTMIGGKIHDNTGASYGGGVHAGGVFNMQGGEIYNNHSYGENWTEGGGGGVYLSSGTVFTMTDGKIYGNSSTYGGGGIYARKDAEVTITGGEIYGNSAPYGGGILLEYRSTFSYWTLPAESPGLDVYANLTVGSDAIFYGNSANAAYNRDPKMDTVYENNIHGTRWTAPFNQGYNNYDINHVYSAPVVIYTVTFKDWDGVILKTDSVEPGGDATAPGDPTREGYTFGGWDNTFQNVQENITVTAQYTPVYRVTFVDWNGIVLKAEQVAPGGNATAPGNPNREGYAFTGWDRGYTDVQSDITVTAQYTQNPVTVTEEQPETTPPGGGGGVTVPDAEDPENPTPEEVLGALTNDEDVDSVTIGNQEVPLSAGSLTEFVWALLNLILMVAGVVLGIVFILHKKREDSEEEAYLYETEEQQKKRKRVRLLWFVVAIVMAIAGIVVFFLTEDFTRLMVLTDNWTIVNAVILAAEIAGMIFSSRRKKAQETEEQQA